MRATEARGLRNKNSTSVPPSCPPRRRSLAAHRRNCLEVTTPKIANLEKLLGTPRDGALLRLALGNAYLAAGRLERAIEQLREAVTREPRYSAAWKSLGKALADADRDVEALAAWRSGIEAARAKGDRQAEKEMTVFARRLQGGQTR